MSRRYDHVVFDLDGTLIDSAADIAAAANHVRLRFGEPEMEVAQVWRHVGNGVHDLLVGLLPGRAAAELEAGVAAYREYYWSHLVVHTRPFPGVVDTLAGLAAAGVTQSVLTNKPAAMARAILERLALDDFFVAVLGGDSTAQRKPHPAGVREVERLTALAPARLLLVGDSEVDRDTARNAGVDFCAASWGYPAPALTAAGRGASLPADLLARIA